MNDTLDIRAKIDQMVNEAKETREGGILDRKLTSVTFRASFAFKAFLIDKAGEYGLTVSEFVEYCIGRSEIAIKQEKELKALKDSILSELEAKEKELATNKTNHDQIKLVVSELSQEVENLRSIETDFKSILDAFMPVFQKIAENGLTIGGKKHYPKDLKELARIMA